MNTTAYITSNAPRKAELDEQIAALDAQIKTAEQQVKGLRASTAEAKTLKKQIARLTQQRQALHAQMPALLFSEAAALADLEAELAAAGDAWDRAKSRWLADAQTNPVYAVKNARAIVAAQAQYEQALRLEERWQTLAGEEGRSLATFRKAYDQVARNRQREMMSKLTAGSSTCAFHNAVEHQQGRALAEMDEYRDHVLFRLTWYEEDAARMPHFDD